MSQVNSGSGLIPEEGIFKAPKEGNYYFQFHGLVRNRGAAGGKVEFIDDTVKFELDGAKTI